MRRGLARLRMRLRTYLASPRALVAGLGAALACATIIAPPLLHAWITTNQLRQRAAELASLGARHVEVQLIRGDTVDWPAQVSMTVLHAMQGANSPIAASWVTDKTGATRMFQGLPVWWPELTAKAPIRSATFQGDFNVSISSREAFVGTFNVGLAFLVLGVAAYVCFRRLPLAALDRAQHRLEAKQVELRAQNLRFDAALNNMSQGLCMFDSQHRLLVCNLPYIRTYDLPDHLAQPGTPYRSLVEHCIGKGLHQGMTADDCVREVLDMLAAQCPTTRVRDMGDGRVIAIEHQPMPGGGWLATHEDITEYRRIEARMTHLAGHDTLTDLPNRVLLRERLEEALEGAAKDAQIAVLCLDLDRFKEINDALGHGVGDGLLQGVGERLRRCVHDTDTIARLGGDEFAIVQVAGEQPIAATSLASSILAAMSAPYEINGQQVSVGVSIGIAVSPGDGNDVNQLLTNANLSLHRAKGEGRATYRFFETGMDAEMQARHRLQLDLRQALANGEFELYYQPVVNLERNQISGLEALLRWHHPQRSGVSPGVFIPMAEETGLIVPIGEWVLRQACMEAIAWPQHVKVAVNLSPAQFQSRNLVQTVFSALTASGLAPGRLELEITESVLLHDNAATMTILHQLRALGVRIAMDDFGTGYSSLSYLRSFPFDKIKIDRCFVKDLSSASDESVAILRAVAGLGISLGMVTTAEGVETQEQVDKVRAEGCTEMQGYFFSPPRPIKDILPLLLPSGARTASAA